MARGPGYIPTWTFSSPISNLDRLQTSISQLSLWSPDLMDRHASKTPRDGAGLGRANLQPCPLDSWLLSSATFLCWPYKQLRKLTSQHPRGQGPKSILGPGYHLIREEVTACPQGGTSNNQVWGSSPHTTPPSSFAPSGLENPGPPRYCPHTHPTFPHRPPWEIFPPPRERLCSFVPSWSLASSHTHSSLDSQAKVWLSLPRFIGTAGRDRACQPHSQGWEQLWLPSELRPRGGAGTVVESGAVLQS